MSFIVTWSLAIPLAVLSTWSPGTVQGQRVAATTSEHERALDMPRVTVNVNNAPLISVLQIIARQAGLTPGFEEALIPAHVRVTLWLRNVPADDAFRQALHGTGLMAYVHGEGDVAILRVTNSRVIIGTITGVVVDGRTKQPLRGVVIGLDGADRVAETAEDGGYRIPNVGVGSHTMTVRRLGYTKMTRTLIVRDNTPTTVDMALEPSVTPLDQVVVTGTIIPTELKAVPNAITVITAKQIEARGITHIDQLFRGDVPGVFSLNLGAGSPLDSVSMFSRGGTSLPSGIASVATNQIKTYVDGIELANPAYLNQIDPKSIERMEILTGPQASTIYGSNAINGVMQIFTKRGSTSKPQLTLNLLSGFVQNNFSNALTPQHDYSAQLSGIEGHLSYNAGGSWNYLGAWTPAKQTTTWGGFGGARMDIGSFSLEPTFRLGVTHNQSHGDPGQWYAKAMSAGQLKLFTNAVGRTAPTTATLHGQTLGMTVHYTVGSRWSQEGVVGTDVSTVDILSTAGARVTPSDSLLALNQMQRTRTSVRYATTLRLSLTSAAGLVLIAGGDEWHTLTSGLSSTPAALTGTLTGTPSLTRLPEHNTGAFVQGQLGVAETLFLTYGVRAEWNPNYGDAYGTDIAPRWGVAYVFNMGAMTAKFRGTYGRSTRPPTRTQKVGSPVITTLYFGSYADQLANPNLGPEYQQGGEGGMELYFGDRTSLTVTRYNQTVDGLIARPAVDSVDELPVWKAFYGDADWQYKAYQYQNLNIGSVRNQGWELQGKFNIGPVTTNGTYSWTKSRIIGITPKYRSRISSSNAPGIAALLSPGASFNGIPEHTWAIGVTYGTKATTIGVNATGKGQSYIFADDLFATIYSAYTPRLDAYKPLMQLPATYRPTGPGYVLADLNVTNRLWPTVDGLVQIQNLTNTYRNDYVSHTAVVGRQVKIGVRIVQR